MTVLFILAIFGCAVCACVAAGYSYGYGAKSEKRNTKKAALLGITAAAFLGLFVSQLAFLAFGGTVLSVEEGYELRDSRQIEAMQSAQGSETRTGGLAFIAVSTTSRTSPEMYYTVLTKEDDGALTQKTFPASKTRIYEVDEGFRYEDTQNAEKTAYRRSGLLWFIGGEEYTKTKYSGDYHVYRVYIPKGSVVLNSYDTGWNG